MFYATNKDNVHYLISNPNDNDKYLCTPDSLKRLRRLIKIDIVEEEEKREYKGVDAFNKVKNLVRNTQFIFTFILHLYYKFSIHISYECSGLSLNGVKEKVKIVDNDKVIYYSKDYFENKNSVIVA